MKIRNTIAVALVASSVALTAVAHSGATGIVLERMQGMSAMGDQLKALAPMMRGEVAYNEAAVVAAARTIAEHSGSDMTRLFPEDASRDKSYAKDTVWTEWERFEALADQLNAFAEGLELAAGNGLATGGRSAGAGDLMGGAVPTTMADMMGGSADSDMSTMMGGSPAAPQQGMMGATVAGAVDMGDMAFAEMPVDMAFRMVTQTCAACHTTFRDERE